VSALNRSEVMMKLLLQISLALLLGLLASVAVARAPLTEIQKIESLITSIETLKGAVFIRNGSEYSAEQAAHHIRMKWDKAGSRVKTAEDFIEKCASQSSMSGEKYQIRFANGKVQNSEDYFREELRKISPPLVSPSPASG
jgi:hypothetical protein